MSATALKKVDAAPLAKSNDGEVSAVFSLLDRAMQDPTISAERLDGFFTLYQRVQADKARKDFTAALVAAQRQMEPVRKNAKNPQTHSMYATFEALDEAARPIYSAHGFAPTYRTEASDKPDHIRVVLSLMHEGGHERDYPIDMPTDGKGPKGNDVMTRTHATGSAFSYGKRYVFGGAFNIITTEKDDDGNRAGGASLPITEAQVNELIKLADDVGADKARFCKHYNITSFADILQSQFQKAKSALEAKRK
jgi:hypothetical protein